MIPVVLNSTQLNPPLYSTELKVIRWGPGGGRKNAQTQRERDTAADMDEARTDGEDDDEGGNSEDEDGEYEDGTGSAGDRTASHSKRRQTRSFYFTTGAVKRMQAKEDGP
jgi:hypothetical protein